MSVRDHRDKADGKRIKRRMPKTTDAKLGTRIHEISRYDEEIPEIDKCEGCGLFTEEEDLVNCEEEVATEYFGRLICHACRREVSRIVDEWEKEAYKDYMKDFYEE